MVNSAEESVEAKSNKDLVEEAFSHATEEASAFMMDMARERALTRNDRSMRLDDRATQVAAIQFAAAAVSATIGGEHPSAWVLATAVAASAAFALGGALALAVARADPVHLPGLPPIWWKDCVNEKPQFDRHKAIVWAATVTQAMFETNTESASRRVRWLNTSLKFGVAGAVLVVIAAGCRMIPH
jgi:hypothetical protein